MLFLGRYKKPVHRHVFGNWSDDQIKHYVPVTVFSIRYSPDTVETQIERVANIKTIEIAELGVLILVELIP